MPQPPAIPEPLHIADKKEGFLNWFADVLWERALAEVEAEQAGRSDLNENQNPTI
jgi:hypothetical protein